ncbi:MAG: hypothetical protein WCF65_10240 [Parachlamydiaceae bacterium]
MTKLLQNDYDLNKGKTTMLKKAAGLCLILFCPFFGMVQNGTKMGSTK